MNGRIVSELPEHPDQVTKEISGYVIRDAVASTSCEGVEYCRPGDEGESWSGIYDFAWKPADPEAAPLKKVGLMDLGAKKNIARELVRHGCEVTIVPHNTTAEEIIAMKPDGIMLSNGPGDPADNTEIIREIATLRTSGIPIFGICLGHQLLALAAGGTTEKMKYGHRGANQPVKRLRDGRVFITSQNHGYCVKAESLPEFAENSFVNANDGTCEGIQYTDYPVFSVQFHPEAAGGPHDSEYLYYDFKNLMEEVAVNAIK